MEVEAEAVGSYYEEDLELLAVALVDAPVAGFHAVGFDLVFGTLGVGHSDGGSVLGWVAAVDGEADAGTVSLHDDGWYRVFVSFNFGETEGIGIVFGGGIDVFDRQGEYVIGERKCGFEESHGVRSVGVQSQARRYEL